MNKLYFNKLIKGNISLANIPASRREDIKKMVEEALANGTITQEQYDSIMANAE